MNVTIRSMSLPDFNQIQDCLTTDFDDFWNENVLKQELLNPRCECFVALLQNEIVGFISIWIAVDDIHLTNIVTKKSHRNQGIAKQLLEYILLLCAQKTFPSLTLEVNENNHAAIHLYETHHFQKIGQRKNYYKQNENAIIMTYYF